MRKKVQSSEVVRFAKRKSQCCTLCNAPSAACADAQESAVVRFVRAWRRRVAYGRDQPVVPDAMRRVRTVDITLPQPLPVQIDGEEYGPTTRLEICVRRHALHVHVPSALTRQRRHDGVHAGERAYG